MSEGTGDCKRDSALKKLKECKKDDWDSQEEAVEVLEECVKEGDVEAMWVLGLCCENRLGVEQDDKRAMELYQEAAGKGCATAEFLLRHKELHCMEDHEKATLSDMSLLTISASIRNDVCLR